MVEIEKQDADQRPCGRRPRAACLVQLHQNCRRLGSRVKGSWSARCCSWRVRSSTRASSSPWYWRATACAAASCSAIWLNETASLSSSLVPPRGTDTPGRPVPAVRGRHQPAHRLHDAAHGVDDVASSSSRTQTLSQANRRALPLLLRGNDVEDVVRLAPGRSIAVPSRTGVDLADLGRELAWLAANSSIRLLAFPSVRIEQFAEPVRRARGRRASGPAIPRRRHARCSLRSRRRVRRRPSCAPSPAPFPA